MIYTATNAPKGTKAFVNGIEFEHALSADTTAGVVEYYAQSLRIKKGTLDTFYTRKARGIVTVEFPQ